ncbi:MAG: hypothetical protein K2Q03_06020 [Sphingobacteriaceae bacterium]|nr:hypothetical protein [Sphingobacteriaceae bacterium]
MSSYVLKSKKLDGAIELHYLNGVLTAIKLDLKTPMTAKQWAVFVSLIRYDEEVLHYEDYGFVVEKLAATNEKIALFCMLYEKYVGVKYKVSGADAGKIKLLAIDGDLLLRYFSSENFLFKGKYSIANLAKYYNELRAEVLARDKPKYPNNWSAAYEAKLPPAELGAYWQHLRGLGLAPKKDRTGRTVDWV